MRHLILGTIVIAALSACGKDGDDKGKGGKDEPKVVPTKPEPPPAPSSIEYKGKEGFVVTAPKEPEVTTGSQPTKGGELPVTIYGKFAPAGSPGALNIMVTDFSAATVKVDPNEVIGGAVGGGALAFPNTTTDKTVPIIGKDPTPGIDASYTVADPAGDKKIRARFHFHNQKLYQVQAFYDAKASDFAAVATKFVESFAFTD